MVSSFADRLWWARHKAGLGATKLARAVKCSQSLISSLERNNAEKSKLNNQFARALGVDPTWLAFGNTDRAPSGFDEAAARQGRERMGQGLSTVVRMPGPEPRWNLEPGFPAEPLAPLIGADAMWKQIVNLYMDYAKLAGPERAVKSLDALRHVVALLSAEEAGGQQQVVNSDEGDKSSRH